MKQREVEREREREREEQNRYIEKEHRERNCRIVVIFTSFSFYLFETGQFHFFLARSRTTTIFFVSAKKRQKKGKNI